jgi:hypothetical protein
MQMIEFFRNFFTNGLKFTLVFSVFFLNFSKFLNFQMFKISYFKIKNFEI